MKISDITASDHRESGSLEGLKESIATVGLLHPVTVVKETFYRPGGPEEGYRLVAGRRRLLACIELGWDEIPTHVLEPSDDEAKNLTEAAELDENLVRKDLTVLEDGEWWARKRQVYERINGKTQHGGDRKSLDVKEKNQKDESSSWLAVLAEETGEQEHIIKRRERIARELDNPTKERVKEIGLDDDLGRLTKLARMPEDERHKVLRSVNSADEFDKKVIKNRTNKSERQKVAESAAKILAEYIPKESINDVMACLKLEGATILLRELRKCSNQT